MYGIVNKIKKNINSKQILIQNMQSFNYREQKKKVNRKRVKDVLCDEGGFYGSFSSTFSLGLASSFFFSGFFFSLAGAPAGIHSFPVAAL